MTPTTISEIDELLRRKLLKPVSKMRELYVHLLLGKIEVGKQKIRISSHNATLERAMTASRSLGVMMLEVEWKWCARRDLNPRPPD